MDVRLIVIGRTGEETDFPGLGVFTPSQRVAKSSESVSIRSNDERKQRFQSPRRLGGEACERY